MRPRPDRLFFFSLSLAEAALFHRVKRDGFLKEVRQVIEEGGFPETVTETLRQTITVNGAGAVGPPNATVTETVTVSVNVGGDPEAPIEGAGEDVVGEEAFEGVRLSFVTETVLQTQEPLTETVVAEASTVTETLPAETVTLEDEGQTVIETVTGQCQDGGGNGSTVTPGAPDLGVLPTGAPEVIIAPNPNPNGNGVGVSTIPIAEADQPRTTLTYDPLANPGGPPAPLEPPVATPAPEPVPTPVPEEPAQPPPPAPEEPAIPPVVEDEVPATTAATEPAVTEAPQEEPAAGDGDGSGEGEQEEGEDVEDDSDDEEDSDEGESSDDEDSSDDDSSDDEFDDEEPDEEEDDEEGGEEDGSEDEEGNEEPDASAPADSVVEGDPNAPAATEEPQASVPELPAIDLSSFTLESQLDLGGLVPRTEAPEPQATGQA